MKKKKIDSKTARLKTQSGRLSNGSVEGTGTRPECLLDRADKKIGSQGLDEKDIQIEKLLQVEQWGCGCMGNSDKGRKLARSRNQIRTLQDCLCCHIYCAQIDTPWHQMVGASLAVLDRESQYPRAVSENLQGIWSKTVGSSGHKSAWSKVCV